ncbi:MAG: glycine/betaine ABC transporter substrate-binding protein [Rhodospirillaceae bacterium]|nr:glycine/betaine ABC transporter substrate-binding protein [Rhodospirillaceae bacterium]
MTEFFRRAATCLAAALVVAGASLGPAAAQDKEITIGWTAWSDAEAVTKLATKILEDRMGYTVNMTMADIGIQYQGVANEDLDVMLMSWLPVTHQNYWKKFAGEVVNLGPLYTRARLGWVVPAYVPENQVSSIADLKKDGIADKFGDKIQGIDPGAGLMQASENAIEEYGLDDYELISASGAAMTAALDRAIRRDEWIVVTGWSPHWMFARWDLRYLKDPKHVLGGLERVHVLARKGLYQDHPDVAEFLTRMYLPLDDLEAMMFEANETSYEEAVDNYIANNKARIDYWVTGEIG